MVRNNKFFIIMVLVLMSGLSVVASRARVQALQTRALKPQPLVTSKVQAQVHAQGQQKNQNRIVILGDSLTEGYGVAQSSAFPQLIQKKVDQDQLPWKVISSGSSGSTSASGLSRMKWIAQDKQGRPDLVLLLLGSNDGLRGLKIEETEKNLNDTISWALENKIQIILGQLYVPPNYGKDYSDQFSKIYSRLAKKHKIKRAPFLLENVAGVKDLNLADGIHPNEKGHIIVAENIYKFLKEQLIQFNKVVKP